MSDRLAEIVFWTRRVADSFFAYTLEFKNRERDMCTEHSMATEQIMNKNHVREKAQKFDEGIVAYNQMVMIHLYKGSFAHFGCVF